MSLKERENLANKIAFDWLSKQSNDGPVNNFETIEKMLNFQDDKEFYFLQILKRKKENPDMKGDSVPLKTVYIHRPGQLMDIAPDLIEMAEAKNARIYLNPNVKSSKKALLQCIAEMARRAAAEDYFKPHKIYDSVVGQIGACRDNRWIVDIDNDYVENYLGRSVDMDSMEEFVKKVLDMLEECEPKNTDKYAGHVITRNGIHIITRPFNPVAFSKVFPKLDVHKNNPTLVYCPVIRKEKPSC
jgi:hypothetical protein